MLENELYDKINVLSIIIILSFFLILCLIYFSVIIYYLLQNYNKKITVLWIDYSITISIGIIFTILYLLTLLLRKEDSIIYLKSLYNNKLIISTISFLILYFYTIINNLIYDVIKSVDISYKIIKFKKINDNNLQNLIEKLKEIDIMNFININKHCYFSIIINVINFILVGFYIIIYNNINIQNEFFSIKDHTLYLMKYYYLIVFLLLILCILIMNILERFFINNKFYSNNKFIINIYNINFKQIIYYIDILFIKISIDLFVNIPLIYYITLSRLNTIDIIIFEICLFVFVFIGGNILLYIDDNNKIKNKNKKDKIIKPKLIKILFIFKELHLNSIDNGLHLFMNEYEYYLNLPIYEKKILSELNLNFIEQSCEPCKNNNKSNFNLNEIEELNANPKIEEEKDNTNINNDDNSEFSTFPEYYILYKLLYTFFDRNKEIYGNLLKKIKKNGGLFRQYSIETNSSGKKSNKKRNRKQKEGDIIINKENIDKINRFSELESKNLISIFKLNHYDIFKTPQEKELLEDLNHKYKNNTNEKHEFIIESLSQEPLFEIFPFYQLKVEDILKSLQPSSNMKVFKLFVDNLNKNNNINESEKNDNNESDKNENSDKEQNKSNSENDESKKGKENIYNNESNSENKSSESSEANCYHSYNYLIMMEIYNKSDFINFDQIIELTSSFKKYLIKKLKSMECTFLPLLLGIYNVKFFGKNKIVVLYRNPLYFANFAHFSKWIHLYITEGVEKNKNSFFIKNDIIDIKEIEIKDNLKLNYNDYEEIKQYLKNDFLFLSKFNFQVFPVAHLFVGDDNNIEEKFKKNSESFIGSLGSQNSFSNLLNSSSEGSNSVNNSLRKKNVLNSDYNSKLEKEYYTINGNKDMMTIKIYLSNCFRYGNKINKEEGKISLFNSGIYIDYLQAQLLSYFIKSTENNNRKPSQTSLKSLEDEKIIIRSGDS